VAEDCYGLAVLTGTAALTIAAIGDEAAKAIPLE
jgi:hypothetical protein